jgi:hypothetical protein
MIKQGLIALKRDPITLKHASNGIIFPPYFLESPTPPPATISPEGEGEPCGNPWGFRASKVEDIEAF